MKKEIVFRNWLFEGWAMQNLKKYLDDVGFKKGTARTVCYMADPCNYYTRIRQTKTKVIVEVVR